MRLGQNNELPIRIQDVRDSGCARTIIQETSENEERRERGFRSVIEDLRFEKSEV